MSYSLFQIIMYAFGGIVSTLAFTVFVVPLRLAERLDRFSLVSLSMFAFVLTAILHFASLLGRFFDSCHFIGDFTTDQYGLITGGSIFGYNVTLNADDARSFNRNVMIFAFMAVCPFLAFLKLNKRSKQEYPEA